MPFAGSQVNASLPWWQQQWFLSLAHGALRYVALLLLAFLLFLGLIKPLLRLLRERQQRAQTRAPAVGTVGAEEAGAGAATASTGNASAQTGPEAVSLPADPLQTDLYVARQLVMQDPARAAQVVKEWLAGERGS
jgi:flagellar M-ring protein FliF